MRSVTETRITPGVPFYDLAAVHQAIRHEIDAAVARVISSGHFVLGPEVEAFEREFAQYCGVEHGVGVGNGLDALRLALTALGIGAGDEVVVPGQTFIATWLAVTATGATPVPADVCEASGQLDPDAVQAALSSRTAAVIAVHLFGSMAPMSQLRVICSRAGIALVEDAAQAHGAMLDGARSGNWSDVAAFSFYPGKNLGALGDGGMAVTRRADIADRMRMLRNYGSRRKYEHDVMGTNSRLDEIQAAVLRAKLPYLDRWNSRRRTLARGYESKLSGVPGVQLTEDVPGSVSAVHLFPVRVAHRARIVAALERNGIEAGIHYPVSPADTPAYRELAGACLLPNSQRWAREEISLPIGPAMDDDSVERVVAALTAALRSVPQDG